MSAEAEAASSEKSLLVSFGLGVQFRNQCDLELNKIYQQIQKPSNEHVDQIQQLRKLAVERANESDQVKVKELTKQIDGIKKGLPAFTASGIFPKGRRKAESLVKHSGRLQIDIDKLPADQVQFVKQQLATDPHMEATFISPTATGVKAIIRIPICDNDQQHQNAFLAAERYFKHRYNLQIDQSCKDVTRLLFASYDPDLVLNPNAVQLNISKWQPKKPEPQQSKTRLDSFSKAKAFAESKLDEACREIGNAAEGSRNAARLKYSFTIAGYVAGKYLDETVALRQLIQAARENSSNPEKAEKDIQDGFTNGLTKPLHPKLPDDGLVVRQAKQLPPPKQVNSDDGPFVHDSNDLPEWETPESIIYATDPKPYPIDSLPHIIQDAVDEVATFVKVPVSMAASAALSAISTVAQAHFDVRRAEGLEGPISLSFLSIADSGDRKTSAARFSKTIQKHEKAERERLESECLEYDARLEAWEAKKAGLKLKLKEQQKKEEPTNETENELIELQQNQPEPIRLPRWQYQDFTIEALGKGLQRWPVAVIESDEGGSVFGGYSMREAAMKVLADLNSFWDGKAIHVDRRQADSYIIDGVRLTVALMIQEPTLRNFLKTSNNLARGTGFLARFLISWPNSLIGQRFFQEPPRGWPALSKFHQRMEHLLSKKINISKQGTLQPETLELDLKARRKWIQFHDDLEGELGAGRSLHDVRDVASKSADNAVRIAANLHAFTTSWHQQNQIGEDLVQSGCDIALWHLYESQRLFDELQITTEQENARLLDDWLFNWCKANSTTEILQRIIQQNGPAPLRSKKPLSNAIKLLSEHNRCRLVKDGKKILVQINPVLLEGNNGAQ